MAVRADSSRSGAVSAALISSVSTTRAVAFSFERASIVCAHERSRVCVLCGVCVCVSCVCVSCVWVVCELCVSCVSCV